MQVSMLRKQMDLKVGGPLIRRGDGGGALFLCHRTNHLRGGTGGGGPAPSRPLTVVKGPSN